MKSLAKKEISVCEILGRSPEIKKVKTKKSLVFENRSLKYGERTESIFGRAVVDICTEFKDLSIKRTFQSASYIKDFFLGGGGKEG